MDRILIVDEKKRKKVVVGYFDKGVFLRKNITPKVLHQKYNGYCIEQETINELVDRACQLVHFEVKTDDGKQIIESEFEDWLSKGKNVSGDGIKQKCLPLKFWREPTESDRIDNKPAKTRKQEKAEKMAIIDMHSPTETRFCRRCEEYTGRGPTMSCQSGRFLTGKTSARSRRKVKFYFLGESPWKDEFADPEGRFLIGRSGQELEWWLESAGVDLRYVYVDNAARCSFPKKLGDYSTVQKNKIRDNCKVYLFSELARLKPEIIIPLGNTAMQALMGVSNITRWIGRIVLYRRLGCYVIPMTHPSAILRGRMWLRDVMIDILEQAQGLLGQAYKFSTVRDIFVTTDKLFDRCMSELEAAKEVMVDIETIGLDYYAPEAQIIGIALSVNRNRGYFLPLWKMGTRMEGEESVPGWEFGKTAWTHRQVRRLQGILKNPKVLKVFHNAGFDLNWLIYIGFKVYSIYDTIIGNSVLDNIDNGLKELSYLHTDFGGYEEELEAVPKLKKSRMDLVDPVVLAKYAAYDGVATYRVKKAQDKMVKTHPAAQLLPELMELRYNLSEMELQGCRVDLRRAKALKAEYQKAQIGVGRQVRRLLQLKELNINSPVKLVEALYQGGGLLSEFRVAHSTDKRVFDDILRKLRRKKKMTIKNQNQRKVIEAILEYRRYGKLISTYLDMFLERNIEQRVHPHFTVHVARTGRLSSRDPNLQNIPREGGIRDCFIADMGYVLVELDYSQLELRIAAEYSQDEKMLTILNDPKGDIHSQVGVAAFKKSDGTDYPIERFKSGEPRAKTKIVSFSTIYGKTPAGLSFDLDCSVEEASRIHRLLFEGFPGLKDFVDRQHATVLNDGIVTNLFGRQYYIEGALSNRQEDIEAAYRKSVNYPVQGTASDVVVLALNRLARRIKKEKWPVQMILTVHDSILFNVERSFKREFLPMCRDEMERRPPEIQYVQLYVDAKVGTRWGSMKKARLR